MQGSQYVNNSSISSYLEPERVEEHCLQFGLPQSDDYIIVARAISQSSQARQSMVN